MKVRAFCDGGLVSNLPVWTFDIDRELDPDCLIVATEFKAPIENDVVNRPFVLLKSILKAAVFGARILEMGNERSRQHGIILEGDRVSTLGLLDFDKLRRHGKEQFVRAADHARTRIIKREGRQKEAQRICQTLAEVVSNGAGVVRAHLASAMPGRAFKQPVKIRYSRATSGQYADDRLLLPPASLVGTVGPEGLATLYLRPFPPRLVDLDRYRKPLIWNRFRWVLVIPIRRYMPNVPRTLRDFHYLILDSSEHAQKFGLAMDQAVLDDMAKLIVSLVAD